MAYRRHHHKKKMQKNIVVTNVEGSSNTTAEIVVQNKIDFVPKVSVLSIMWKNISGNAWIVLSIKH